MYQSLPPVAQWLRKKYPLHSNILDANNEPVIENVELWKRDPMEVIKELLQNPEWKNDLQYVPQKLYVDSECTERIYNEMWTVDWWIEKHVSFSKSI